MSFWKRWSALQGGAGQNAWIVRLSVRLAPEDDARLGLDAARQARAELCARVSDAVRPEDRRTQLSTEEHLIAFDAAGNERGKADPIVSAKRLIETLSQPLPTEDGLAFPRINAAFTLKPCSVRDVAARGLLAIGLRRAQRAGPGVAVGVDCEGAGRMRLFGLDTPDLALDMAIRRAIDARRLLMHYQPLVRLSDGRVAAVEALMRILSPKGCLVSPHSFIDSAERSGLIAELWRFALRDAAGRLRDWRAALGPAAPKRVAVNVSAAQLCAPGFMRDAIACFEEIGMDALTVEITESRLIREMPRAIDALSALRESGARVALDDFGVEYSSLAHLRRIPVDVLKLDRSFLQGVPEDDRALRIFAKIVELAHILEAEVVAEGVETEAQVQALLACGVEFGQGAYFGRAMDPEGATGFLAKAADQAVPPPEDSISGETPSTARA